MLLTLGWLAHAGVPDLGLNDEGLLAKPAQVYPCDKEGKTVETFESGKRKSLVKCKKGKLKRVEVRHDNGELKLRLFLIDGTIRIFESGTPNGSGLSQHYSEGRRDTLYQREAAGGKLTIWGPYERGVPHGCWVELRPNGRPIAAGRYAGGVQVGHWVYWPRKGKPTHEKYRGAADMKPCRMVPASNVDDFPEMPAALEKAKPTAPKYRKVKVGHPTPTHATAQKEQP